MSQIYILTSFEHLQQIQIILLIINVIADFIAKVSKQCHFA